eukprot:scaffold567099_cov18-Prasinocladus_malaysianus.AAC.2
MVLVALGFGVRRLNPPLGTRGPNTIIKVLEGSRVESLPVRVLVRVRPASSEHPQALRAQTRSGRSSIRYS